ncbi:MAG: hypothetical protein Q8R18_03990 [bacterium]|nr:hypothetical protein [bacterium]
MIIQLETITKPEIDTLEKILDKVLGTSEKEDFGSPPCLERVHNIWYAGWFFHYKNGQEKMDFRSKLAENAPDAKYYGELELNISEASYNLLKQNCKTKMPKLYYLLPETEGYAISP